MTRVAWLTDIHLNFLTLEQSRAFLKRVAQQQPDIVLIGGDIGEAHDLERLLTLIADELARPIYFVLGNHDYYHGSIRDVRQQMVDLGRRVPNLQWLPAAGVVELTKTVGLVGHDGWGDGRLGDYERSIVVMNDYRLIEELAPLDKRQRWDALKALGDEAAASIGESLPAALASYEHVVLLTHVPPWREACWYQGQTSDDHWAPHFTCGAMGQTILRVMEDYPQRQLTVLCGHTHSPGQARPLPNIHVLTGGAEYGTPHVQRVFEF